MGIEAETAEYLARPGPKQEKRLVVVLRHLEATQGLPGAETALLKKIGGALDGPLRIRVGSGQRFQVRAKKDEEIIHRAAVPIPRRLDQGSNASGDGIATDLLGARSLFHMAQRDRHHRSDI
ncbi:MAG: hypothetical protein O7H41_05355 [Planctomycetota bacterium]|nr:hypothetical protein [Planctomycetota bacterium]